MKPLINCVPPVIAQVDTSKVVWKDGRVVYVEKATHLYWLAHAIKRCGLRVRI